MGDRAFKPTPLVDILAPRRAAARTPTSPWRGRPGDPKPLWAILGEEPPYGWRSPVVSVPLAPPDATDADVVRLAADDDPGTRNDTAAGRFKDDLADGATSWFRGIGRAGGQILDMIGATNAQDQAAAGRANRLALDALRDAITHPGATLEIIKRGVPLAGDYLGDRPGIVAGRAGTGLAIGALAGRSVAGPLSLVAIYGDILHAIRNGATSYDDIVRSVLGGESPGQP
jgi:hypothetical protein